MLTRTSCFYKLWGVRFVGVLMMRALLFGVFLRAPDFWKLPCSNSETEAFSVFAASSLVSVV